MTFIDRHIKISFQHTGYYFFILLFCFQVTLVKAQSSQVSIDPNQLYHQGLDFIKQKNFAIAKEYFTQFLDRKEVGIEKKYETLKSDAKFYQALCAFELGQKDAEKLMLDYIEKEDETPTKKLAYYHLGRLLFDNKEYKQAIEYFEKVETQTLSKAERDEYKFELGYSYFITKKLDEAFNLFKEIKEVQNKYYYPSNYYYGYISYTKQKFDDALKSFEKLKESKLYEKVIPYYIAQIYFQRKQFDKVIEYLQPLIADANLKYFEELNLVLGQAYFENKNYEKTIKHIEVYLKKSKARKEELFQLGYAYYKTNKYAEAINNLQQLSSIQDSVGQNAVYILGDCFLETGNKQKALSAFQQASNMSFDEKITEEAIFNYAKLSAELGYGSQAIATFQNFIVAYPNSAHQDETKEILSDLLLTTKNYIDGLSIIESINNKTPKVNKAYQQIAFLRGLEVYNDKNFIEAIRLFNISLKNPIEPEFKSMSYYWIGECQYELEKYKDALSAYNMFLELASVINIKDKNWYFTNAQYGAGYCLFKQQQYAGAARFFTDAISNASQTNKQEAKTKIIPDASLRNGDCNFMTKNYATAINNYDAVIESKSSVSDYALFQKGTIQGIQGNYEAKIITLENIARVNINSIYLDDAQYNIGDAYLALNKYNNAISTFNNLIAKFANSSFVSKSYIKLGLIYYNQDNINKAAESYKTVIDKYPQSNDAKEALVALKDMSIAEGNPDLYMDVVSNNSNIKISSSEKDSISYLSAETQYAKGNCEDAIKKFDNYINLFANGYFILQAQFYRSECLFKSKQYVASVKGYEYVADAGQNIFREKALVKAAEINYFELKNTLTAEKYYGLLLENATASENIFLANLGLMRCAFQLNEINKVNVYADKILNSSQSNTEQITEAHFYLAKYYLEQNNYANATINFNQVIKKTSNVFAAESQYLIALILFNENKIKEAEDETFKVIDNFSSYNTWVLKAYLLLADIYETQKDYFQAKATLQSIIENADDEKVKLEATNKLNDILEKESKTSQLIPDGMNMENALDTIEMK